MHCELKVDLCTFSNFCIKRNADSCEDHGSNVSCICKNGWSGSNCGINFDDCLNNKCLNGARCVDKLNGYDCNCLYGFTGVFCESESCFESFFFFDQKLFSFITSSLKNFNITKHHSLVCRNNAIIFGIEYYSWSPQSNC